MPQLSNAYLPKLFNVDGNVILVKLLQSSKADEPILVTPFGITILVKLLQPEKAYEPMLVTPLPETVEGSFVSLGREKEVRITRAFLSG